MPDKPLDATESSPGDGKSAERSHVIRLTSDDFDGLLLAIGYAAGAAMRDGNRAMFLGLLRLANAINEGNPRWTRYNVEAELASLQSRVDPGDDAQGPQAQQEESDA